MMQIMMELVKLKQRKLQLDEAYEGQQNSINYYASYAFKVIISHLLNMQMNPQGASTEYSLQERINALLSRENLCSSLYLAKFIAPNLTLPLYALVEERTVAQITNQQELIIKAIQQSKLAKVVNHREVHLIPYPTIKISASNELIFKEIEVFLNQLQKQYSFSSRCDDQFINLTLYEEDSPFLDQVMASLSQKVNFEKINLFDDIKVGTAAAKQNKHQHWKAQNKKHYSLERPPQIFIRRAIESEEEQPQRERPRGKETDKRRRYKEVVRQASTTAKPLFSNEDFPLLS